MRDSKFVTKAGPQKGSAAVGVNSDYTVHEFRLPRFIEGFHSRWPRSKRFNNRRVNRDIRVCLLEKVG